MQTEDFNHDARTLAAHLGGKELTAQQLYVTLAGIPLWEVPATQVGDKLMVRLPDLVRLRRLIELEEARLESEGSIA
jgi:hypothetical protein